MTLLSPAAAAPAERPSGWLRGPAFDGALLLVPLALALGLGAAAAVHPPFFFHALMFDIWVLAYPHVTSTYTRIAFDRADLQRHWPLLTLVPLLALAGTAGVGALGGVGGLFTAYYLGQTYHYARQSYGIARAYRRRGGGEAATGLLADAVVYAFPVWGLLHRAQQGHSTFYQNPLLLPRVPAPAAHLAGGVAVALFMAWGYRELRALRAGRHHGHALFVLSHVLVTAVSYLLVTDITVGWLIVNIWHNAQYLFFVWGFNTARFHRGVDDRSAFLSRLCQPRNVGAYALVCVAIGAGIHELIEVAGKHLQVGLFPVLLVLHLSVNFHHYLVDGVIWKRQHVTV
jgi:hypothetical protein